MDIEWVDICSCPETFSEDSFCENKFSKKDFPCVNVTKTCDSVSKIIPDKENKNLQSQFFGLSLTLLSRNFAIMKKKFKKSWKNAK